MNRELFEYDPQTHTGTYKGKPIPSVTQLVDILYPMSKDIPQERITKAAERGTMIHELIEMINTHFDTPLPFDMVMKELIKMVCELTNKDGKKELVDYVSLINAYKLRPFDFEELIFLLDEQGEPICFGHYDLTAMPQEDNILFTEGKLNLFDYKTTSLFDKKKVSLQESIYAYAYEQCSGNPIENIYGIWLTETPRIIPLKKHDKTYVVELCKGLAKIWYDRR